MATQGMSTNRPRLLDLFAGAQGAGVGYARAGFEVHAVDIEPHAKHPEIETFTVADAMDLLNDEAFLRSFDAIHASPPCQSETVLRHIHRVRHPNLLGPTLIRLRDMPGLTWVVENVAGTRQMHDSLVLCGAAFGLGAHCRDGEWRPLRRHRRFASSVFLLGHGCACSGREPVGVYGNGSGGTSGSRRAQGSRAGYQATKAEASEALGIDWMGTRDLSQAIPPAYTQFIGDQLLVADIPESGRTPS